MRPPGWFLAPVLVFFTSTASAHSQVEGAANFYWGIIHPFYELSVALILVAFGLLAGRIPNGKGTTKLMVLYLVTLFVTIAGAKFAGFVLPSAITLGLAIFLGLCVAANLRLPLWLMVALALITALAAGSTSPPDLDNWRENLIMAAGTWLGLTLVPVYIIVMVRQLKRDWHFIGVRILGSWITACSVLVLCLKFSQLAA